MIRNLPVLGFQDNDIGTSDSSIDRWVDDVYQEMQTSTDVQSRAVGKFTVSSSELNGFHASYLNGSQAYLVYQSVKPIGVLVLQRNEDRVWATDTIGVLPEYQGQSLGTILYETALSDLGKIGSSTSLSGGSSKIWKALCIKHKGTYVISAEYSGTGKPVEVQIKDWSLEGRITYPVFSLSDGTLLSLRTLNTRSSLRGKKAASEGYYLIRAFGSNPKVSDNWPFN